MEPSPRSARVAGLDLLRGLVMVLMTLDHSRALLGAYGDPLDLASATPAWFLTRWVTHLCAPTFVALAGMGAALSIPRAGAARTCRFLWTRGLWLILLEVTLVNLAWQFGYPSLSLLVIWVLGASMVLLSGLVRLHRLAPLAFGLAVVLGHDLLAGFRPAEPGWLAAVWGLCVAPGSFHLGALLVSVPYPCLPWAGLMALGFAAAPWIAGPAGLRRGRAAALGGSFLVAFALLRGLSLYGEPRPWAAQARGPLYTFLSLLDCTKYPPSLQYLLMTLGLSLLILVLLDRLGTRSALGLRVLGRVPLFYYLLHVPLLHLGARLLVSATLAPGARLEPSLGRVYLGWVLTLLVLWPLCQGWDRIKSTRDGWWLRYL